MKEIKIDWEIQEDAIDFDSKLMQKSMIRGCLDVPKQEIRRQYLYTQRHIC